MTDRPILFSAPMVKALLDGRKGQTRLVLKPQPEYLGGYGDEADPEEWGWIEEDGTPLSVLDICPNGYMKGDRLWVREAHALVPSSAYRMSDGVAQAIDPADADMACVYQEGWERCAPRWRPSIHMPRWASRLTLTVTEVRVQRLQEISEADAVAEGIEPGRRLSCGGMSHTAVDIFCDIWTSIHGPEAWALNPWCAVLSFTVHRCNIDQMPGGNHE